MKVVYDVVIFYISEYVFNIHVHVYTLSDINTSILAVKRVIHTIKYLNSLGDVIVLNIVHLWSL